MRGTASSTTKPLFGVAPLTVGAAIARDVSFLIVTVAENSTNWRRLLCGRWWQWSSLVFGFVLLFGVEKIDDIVKGVQVTLVVDLVAIICGETCQKNYLQKSS